MEERAVRRLATAVIVLAAQQAKGEKFVGRLEEERAQEQQQARTFLEGVCDCLAFWCELAEVDPEKIRKQGRALTSCS